MILIQDLEFDIDLKRKTISKEYCKQNDTLNLIFNIYDNGEAVDLTGFTAILNCNINNTNQVLIKNDGINIDYNKITIFDKDKYITCLGENATLEIVLSKDDIQKTSFNISLEVDKSIMNTTGHLEEVVITALANLQEDLNKASATVQKLEEENTKANNNTNSLSTENTRSETNYNNLKNINNNLSDLLEANSTAETNINNLITENNKATANIEAMQKLGDVTNLAQQVETNKENITEITTQLNASTNIQNISLVNGWVEYGEGFSKPKCIKIGKMIMVSGIIRNGTSSTIGYLPEGYRPEKTEPVCVELGDKTLVSGLIGNDGVLIFPGAESKNSTISFNFSFISK